MTHATHATDEKHRKEFNIPMNLGELKI